ncbi:MAG: glutamate synthase subunit beta [Lachnospirales bacterium]
MGKPTGFLEYDRKLPEDRSPEVRMKDWAEFHTHCKDIKELQTQGARCMNCGVPFCHTGDPVVGGCPLGNLIPEWNDLVYHGKIEEAYKRLTKTSNFPEFTGRVCPALCEGSCTLGMHEPPVTVKNIEVHIIDKMFEEGKVLPRIPKKSTSKRVAVVGSGPSGLACADILNQLGHKVTVYERADRIGGLLMYGIPNMKLDKKIVQRRVDLLTKEGITFVTNTEIGKNYPSARLINEYDAVVLCCGATKPRDLVCEGREGTKNIYFAVDFLKANTKSLLDSKLQDRQYISAEGKDVIIIGGGDTGTDCVGTSIRHGCNSVHQIEIMPEAPLSRTEANHWPQWPRVRKTDYGQEEAIKLYGKDPREYLTTVTKVVPDEKGNIKEVHTVNVKWNNVNGRMVPEHIKGSEKVWPCQLLLIAMGFTGPEDTLVKQLSLETDQRSNVKAEYGKFETSLKGVFAAGDMRRGQSLVVWAIHEGREAAKACDEYLRNK